MPPTTQELKRTTDYIGLEGGIEGFEKFANLFAPWVQDMLFEHQIGLEEAALDIGMPMRIKVNGKRIKSELIVKKEEINRLVSSFDFRSDGRAGVSRKGEENGLLHRISRIRERNDLISGIRFRVGRFIDGVADSLEPYLQTVNKKPPSVLLCGRPGGGKTTLLRCVVELLGRHFWQNLVIVDTSNEIGGDGMLLHPSLGLVTRYQVPDPLLQGRVMMEALGNASPEVIVCDEIGVGDEVPVVHTLSKRGVGLVATAHGSDFDELLENEKISVLLGHYDVKSKTRHSNPSFKTVVEIIEKGVYKVYPNLLEAIDAKIEKREPESIIVGPRAEAYKASLT
jgi:stage III sporulation protein SpoIIIAA